MRPQIQNYQDPVDFMRDMIQYRKSTEERFSVHGATQPLRKLSPALVTLVLQRKRNLSLDRAEEFSKLLGLNTAEKIHFKNWLTQMEKKKTGNSAITPPNLRSQNRKNVSTSILNDWINVYIKDFFQFTSIQEKPEQVKRLLGHLASPQRIEKSLKFLTREGHLRRTMEGSLVPETNLAVADPKIPSRKIRQFHKGALSLAKQAIDLFPPTQRYANALVLPLNEKRYQELTELIQEFAEKLQEFSERPEENEHQLYQVLINLSPVGGKPE